MRWDIRALVVCVAFGGAILRPVFAAPDAADVSDAQVVAAMKRGVDYLLRQKKEENWEGTYGKEERFSGGETALVLTALLETWHSLADDAELRKKLDPEGPEVQPALRWLTSRQPVGTYTVGLQAQALALVPAPKAGAAEDWLRSSAESCKWYLVATMGADGGYSYEMDRKHFDRVYDAYMRGALAGKVGSTEKAEMDNTMMQHVQRFGGPEAKVRWKAFELHQKLKQTKEPQEVTRIKGELKELEAYLRLAKLPSRKVLQEQLIATYRKRYEETLKRLRTADPGLKKSLAASAAADKETVERLERRFEPKGDASNAYTAAMGAAALCWNKVPLPAPYWETTERLWRLLQKPDGSWPYYMPDPMGRDTKTVAVEGLACLLVARTFTDMEVPLRPKPDKHVEAALGWLSKEFPGDAELQESYALCAVQRVGELSGSKSFGGRNWYSRSAAELVSSQRPDGSWAGRHEPRVNTACALTFLARGRNPVLFNKLQYNGPWNARPWDAMFATQWLQDRMGKRLNWQVVNLQMTAEEWQDAPVLLITGSQDPKLTKEDLEKLRTFIAAGGTVFSSADGGNAGFTAAIKRYAAEVVEQKFELRPLARNHELFGKDSGADLSNPPALLGVSDGSREVWIHSAADVGADWQTRRVASKGSFDAALTLYMYASNKGKLRPKLQAAAAR